MEIIYVGKLSNTCMHIPCVWVCWYRGRGCLVEVSDIMICIYMMTSSNGNIFRVTGPLWGNPPTTGEYPSQSQWRKALMSSLMCAWTHQCARMASNAENISIWWRNHGYSCSVLSPWHSEQSEMLSRLSPSCDWTLNVIGNDEQSSSVYIWRIICLWMQLIVIWWVSLVIYVFVLLLTWSWSVYIDKEPPLSSDHCREQVVDNLIIDGQCSVPICIFRWLSRRNKSPDHQYLSICEICQYPKSLLMNMILDPWAVHIQMQVSFTDCGGVWWFSC